MALSAKIHTSALATSPSIAQRIEDVRESARRGQIAPLDAIRSHFSGAHYVIADGTDRRGKNTVELTPKVIGALRKLDEIISERRESPRKLDPLASVCQNFVRGDTLSDPSAPLIRIILGDITGTVFEGGVPEGSIRHVSASLERVLDILMQRAREEFSRVEEAPPEEDAKPEEVTPPLPPKEERI